MKKRYNHQGKTYFLDDLDMKRVAYKKTQKFLDKLPPEKREVFEKIWNAISSALKWENFSAHVENALLKDRPYLVRGNMYDLLEQINKIIRRIDGWVRRNIKYTKNKVQEFAIQLHKAARSICRVFDENATCWLPQSEKIVADNV